MGTVNGRTYAFIALERIGGVMIYDITVPAGAKFVNYINSREFAAGIQGDVSPEGLCFVSAAASRTGRPLLLATCGVSGTLAVYELSGKPASGGSTGGSDGSGSQGIIKAILAGTVTEPDLCADVPAGSCCRDAVQWAVNAGILKGSGNRLLPKEPCTRGQIVTMLYRLLEG